MTIRDVENATGMTRANIRFYEDQGLISPERQPNGYREYAQEHVDVLLRVKLLRALGMSIEKIKSLQTGGDMLAALEEQIEVLGREQERLENAQRVCREMRGDRVAFATLDAQRYLRSMDSPPRPTPAAQEAITRDVPPRIFAPWRRYWARWLDHLICGMLVTLANLYLMNGQMPSILTTIAQFALLLILEPVQLTLFGTTLGKWIFGIRVRDLDGRKLSLSQAFSRTCGVLMYGLAFGIPLLNLWRLWKSYKTYDWSGELPWEEDSELSFRDLKFRRFPAAVLAGAGAFGLMVALAIPSFLPDNRGDLTVAQFAENYRQMAVEYDMTGGYELTDDGTWFKPASNSAYFYITGNAAPLDFTFTTEDGLVTGLSFSEEISGDRESWLGTHESQRLLSAMAFVYAQEELSVLAGHDRMLLEAMQADPLEDLTLTVAGVRIEYDIEYAGYYAIDSSLHPDEDSAAEPYYSMEFRLTKVD